MDTRVREELLTLPVASEQSVIADSGAILKFLASGDPARPAWWDRSAIAWATADYPERFTALRTRISLHPSVAKLRGEFYCGFAKLDSYAWLHVVRQRVDAIGRFRYEIHTGRRAR
jgi:hypothetical protein